MIYLIGTRHEFQHDGLGSVDESVKRKFISYLESMIKEYGASLIAEEFNEEELQKSNATIDTARHIADKLNIRHLFCDPNKEERKIIGIPCREEIKITLNIQGPVIENSVEDNRIKKEQRKYHQIREKFWLSKIERHLNETMLFICGADHIKNFEILLMGKGYKSMILVENWRE